VPIPPLKEQQTILNHLREATADDTQAISLAQREINLLLEYRTRLIADVVTGKLDVREVAAKLPDDERAPDELLEPDELEADADEDAALMEAEEEAA
jgi:restriction endonuclease S subunit